MKGIVFTEFLDMVGQRHSLDMVDDLIDAAQLPSGGAYTAVGTYPHQEMVALVSALSQRVAVPVPLLLQAFGEHLFGRFVQRYPAFFVGRTDVLAFLAGVEDIIHVEVLKLYPDAQLPRFEVESHTSRQLVLRYHSARHLEDLAEGLIRGCARHFGQALQIERAPGNGSDDHCERFTLTLMD